MLTKDQEFEISRIFPGVVIGYDAGQIWLTLYSAETSLDALVRLNSLIEIKSIKIEADTDEYEDYNADDEPATCTRAVLRMVLTPE